jgi:hypothetical protein
MFGKFLNSCATDGFSRRTQLHEVMKLGVGSYIGEDDDYSDNFHDFRHIIQANPWIVSRLGNVFFLPEPFQLIIHPSFRHPTVHGLDIESVVK